MHCCVSTAWMRRELCHSFRSPSSISVLTSLAKVWRGKPITLKYEPALQERWVWSCTEAQHRRYISGSLTFNMLDPASCRTLNSVGTGLPKSLSCSSTRHLEHPVLIKPAEHSHGYLWQCTPGSLTPSACRSALWCSPQMCAPLHLQQGSCSVAHMATRSCSTGQSAVLC